MRVGDAPPPRRALRVLAAIELGGNWGHLLRMQPLLALLGQRGHACALATTDVDAAARVFAGAPVRLFACPSLRRTHPVPAGLVFKHYVQILEHCVFGDEAVLASNVRQWMALIRLARPEAMLTDFSPLALLVAHLCAVPVVQVPTGWEAPPAGVALPSIPPWHDVDPTPFVESEARLLARLNRQCAVHGAAPFERVSDLYAVGSQLLGAWPETDHFGARTSARYTGPIFSGSHGQVVEWAPARSPARPRVFVYLSPDARNVDLVTSVAQADADVIAVLPGLAESEARRLRELGVQVFGGAVQLEPALGHARLVISNGGHGLIGASLRAGVPLLMLPMSAEQAMLVDRLVAQGLANRFGAAGQFAADIQQALADDASHANAQAFARRYSDFDVDTALQAVADEVERAAEPLALQI